MPTSSGACNTSLLQLNLTVCLYGGWPTLHWRHGRVCIYCEVKGENEVESKVEGLVVLGIIALSNLPLLRVIGLLHNLVTPAWWDLINILNNALLPYPNLAFSAPRCNAHFSEAFYPWGGSGIWGVYPGTLFILDQIFKPGCVVSIYCWVILHIFGAGLLWSRLCDQYSPRRCSIQTGPF